MNPEVLLFDEPTAALDPRTQQWLIELIVELNRAGKTIVLATHDLARLDVLADRCVVFSEDHRIVGEGTPHGGPRRPATLLRTSTSSTSTATSTARQRTATSTIPRTTIRVSTSTVPT